MEVTRKMYLWICVCVCECVFNGDGIRTGHTFENWRLSRIPWHTHFRCFKSHTVGRQVALSSWFSQVHWFIWRRPYFKGLWNEHNFLVPFQGRMTRWLRQAPSSARERRQGWLWPPGKNQLFTGHLKTTSHWEAEGKKKISKAKRMDV